MKNLLPVFIIAAFLIGIAYAFAGGSTATPAVLMQLTSGAGCGSGPSPCAIPYGTASNPLPTTTTGH